MLVLMSKFAILIAFLLVFLRETKSADNILLNKPILAVSDYPTSASALNDNSNSTCSWFDSESKKFISFDLGKVYSIEKIVVFNGKYRAVNPAYFYIGNTYRTCQFQNLMNNYTQCDPLLQNAQTSVVNCNPSVNIGRYLVLMKGDPFNYQIFERLYLCEIFVYGVEAPNVDIPTRPQISSQPLPSITKSNYKIAPLIRQNVPALTMPVYSSAVVYINENCEPIVYDNRTSYAFGVACQTPDGNGKIVVFAKYKYFTSLYSFYPGPAMSQFKSNLIKWMSPNNVNGDYINSNQVKTMTDFSKVKQGYIIYFDMYNPCPNDILQTWKALLLNGTISMAMDITFWGSNSDAARNNYLQILNIFNVDFYNYFVTWSTPVDSLMDDSIYNENLLGLEESLNRMQMNHDYLLKVSASMQTLFQKYSYSMLAKSKASNYLIAIVKKYENLLQWICPCDIERATDTTDRKLLLILGEIMKSQLMANSGFKAPCVSEFPGDYKTPPEKKEVTLNLLGVTPSTLNPIGYYLRAGETLSYVVSQSTGIWTMSVGCHTDLLTDNRPEWARYPSIYVDNVPISGTGQVYSPFGGVLWLYNDVVNASLTIKLSNVVKTRFFNLRDDDAVSKWDSGKNDPGLWVQIAGDSMVFCQQSSQISSLSGDYLVDLMTNIWDPTVRLEMFLTTNDWKVQRPQITILDVMISAGYGHSGYPIALFQCWNDTVFNSTGIRNVGSWGMCHEIGHNMQKSKWTFVGTTEVTNNLQCLFVYDKLYKIPRYGQSEDNLDGKNDNIKAFLNSDQPFNSWTSDPWKALLIYAQLANHMGWGFYKKIFEYYENNNLNPSTNAEKMTTFMNISSLISQQNLIPMFDFWGFVINDNLNTELSKMKCFFPANDFFSMMSDKRRNYISGKYSNCNSVSTFFQDISIDSVIVGERPNFIKEIN